jgi:hypothetical protein
MVFARMTPVGQSVSRAHPAKPDSVPPTVMCNFEATYRYMIDKEKNSRIDI